MSRLEELTRFIPRRMMEDFDERAGIMEFDGKLSKAKAEAKAAKIVLKAAREAREK